MTQIETALWPDKLRKSQSGDQKAYAELLQEVSIWLKPYAQKLIQSKDVDDLIQNTLIALHNSLHTYNPELAAEPWIYTLLKYKAFDKKKDLKKQRRFDPIDEKHLNIASPEKDPLELSQAEEILARLSPENAEALRLTKIEGFSIKETAQSMNRSESWVKVTVFRALAALRDELKEATK